MNFHRDNFSFACIAVKTHFLETLKICFHSGGGTVFFTKLQMYRKGQDEIETQLVYCEKGSSFGDITQLHFYP